MASLSHPDSEIDHVLRYIKDKIRVLTYDHSQGFVPRHQLRAYMTYERTGKLLESCCGDSLKCKTIHAEYLAVFVILLQIGQPAFILHFIQHKRFRDRFLPFDNFESWPAVCRQLFSDFYEKQWEFCAEEFTLHLDDTVFDPRSIIPIVFQEELKGGPDSWTFKIRIHPDYNCLLSSEAGIEQSQYFILKVCKTDKKHLHHQEVRAYTELSRHKDIANHIAHFYGSWRHNDTYNLLLEYVEGNTLENVFKEENPTSGDDRLKFLTNLLRIMDPVLRIHCHGDTTDHNEVAQGAHQDIKPDNILVTLSRSPSKFDRTFKLADLGSCYLPPKDRKNKLTRGRDTPGTQMFSAPECFRDEADLIGHRTSRPLDSKKDIWSLGCTFSEAVVWCVLGERGLRDYRQCRKVATTAVSRLQGTAYVGCFHNGEALLPAVREIHMEVRKVRATYDQIVNDVLPIIEDMLQHVSKRIDARTARERFNRALYTAKQMQYPSPFQDKPDPPLLPPQTPSNGLGLAFVSPSATSRTVNRDRAFPISDSFSSTPTIDERLRPTSTPVIIPHPALYGTQLSRSATEREPRTSNYPVRSPSLINSWNKSNGDRGSSMPESSMRNHLGYVTDPRLISTPNPANGGEDGILDQQGLVGAEQIRMQRLSLYATVNEVLRWSRGVKRHSWSPRDCPVSMEYLENLRGTDQIFIVDNSASMKQYRHEVRDTFEGLAYLVKRFDLDGIDLSFTTSSEQCHGQHRTEMLERLANIQYRGDGQMELILGRILGDSNNTVWRKARQLLGRKNNWGKSIYVLTDGRWFGDDESLCGIPELIQRVVSKLDAGAKLGIQFIQFGDDPIGSWRLKELDDGLKKHGVTMDIIDTEPYTGNIYKMLLGHLVAPWDQELTSPVSPASARLCGSSQYG